MNAEVLWAWSINETFFYTFLLTYISGWFLWCCFLLFQFSFTYFFVRKKVSRVFPFKFSYIFFNHKNNNILNMLPNPTHVSALFFFRLVFLLFLIEVQKKYKIKTKWKKESQNPHNLERKKNPNLMFCVSKRRKKRDLTQKGRRKIIKTL